MPADTLCGGDVGQRAMRHLRNQPAGQVAVRSRLHHQRQLERRVFHLHGGLRVGEQRAVHDVGPLDQLCQVVCLESEFLGSDEGNQLGAGLEARVVELLPAAVLAEVGGVFRRQKGALMVIEPPVEPRRGRVLEVHDGIFVPVKQRFIEQLRSAVRQTRVGELGFRADTRLVEPGKDSRRSRAVEAAVMEKYMHLHGAVPLCASCCPPVSGTDAPGSRPTAKSSLRG